MGFVTFNDFKIRFKGPINALGLLPNIMITELTFLDYENSLWKYKHNSLSDRNDL